MLTLLLRCRRVFSWRRITWTIDTMPNGTHTCRCCNSTSVALLGPRAQHYRLTTAMLASLAFLSKPRNPTTCAFEWFSLPQLTRFRHRVCIQRRQICGTWPRWRGQREPSPHYNQSIVEDMFVDQHSKYLRDAAAEVEYLEDACMLLKVWAARRGMLGAPDGFTGFVLSMLMSHLVTTGGKLNPLMDAQHLVKGALTPSPNLRPSPPAFARPSIKI